jgi:hypothetical protein
VTEDAPPPSATGPGTGASSPENTWDEAALPAAEARAWIAGAVPGRPRVAGPLVVYNRNPWGMTAGFALRHADADADAEAEEVVFKVCCLAEFAASGRLGAVLTRHCAGRVPHLSAWAPRGAQTLTLFRPFAGRSVRALDALAPTLAMARAFAAIQATVAALPPAERAAFPRLPLAAVPGLLDGLLADIADRYLAWWRADDRALMAKYAIPEDIGARLAAFRPRLRAWAAELAGGGWPESVDHVDLLPHNAVVQPDGRVLIYDWEQATVGCPFLSVDVLLLYAQQIGRGGDGYAIEPERATPATRAVRAAYLSALPWGRRAARERAFDLALCLAPLRYADSEGRLARRCGQERALAESQAWWAMRALRRWEAMGAVGG